MGIYKTYKDVPKSSCTVVHSAMKICHTRSCSRMICYDVKGEEWAYDAVSSTCPNMTLSSEYNECQQQNLFSDIDVVEINTTRTCYIASCESRRFVWNWKSNKNNGLAYLISGSVLIGFACFIVPCIMIMIHLGCIECCWC